MDNYYLALRIFLFKNAYELMFDETELPDISFDFKEPGVKEEIIEMISKELKINCGTIQPYEAGKIMGAINNPDYTKPTIEITDHIKFFNYLSDIMNRIIDPLEKTNIMKYIWLRMTRNDFKHPEAFLEKNVNILHDITFSKYIVERAIENEFFNDYTLTAVSINSHFYNESMKEMKFTLIKDTSEYVLPVVRYGIYKKNNEKICEIGSIQNIIDKYQDDEQKHLEKKIDRLKYKINQGVEKELLEDIEPKKLISLLLFIKLLQDEGVKRISVPSNYPLDKEYHIKRVDTYKSMFNARIDDERVKNMINRYNRVDDICKTKSEDFIKLFKRMMYHIVDSKVITYPTEEHNYLELEISSLDSINGENIKKLIKN